MNLYADSYRKIRYVIPVMTSNKAIPMRIDTKRLSVFFAWAPPGAGEGVV